MSTERRLHPRLENENPFPLSDEGLYSLLAGLGNHEGKALLVALMEKDRIYTKPELHQLMIGAQGDKPAWELHRGLITEWITFSLKPIGFVAEEVIDSKNNVYGYTLTDYGIDVGKPAAGILLDFSLQRPEISLHQIFGSTSSSNKDGRRSPQTRFLILNALAKNPAEKMTVSQLVRKLASFNVSQSSVIQALKELNDTLVTYQTKDSTGQTLITISTIISADLEGSIRHMKPYRAAVIRVLREHAGEELSLVQLLQLVDSQNAGNTGRIERLKEFLHILQEHHVITGLQPDMDTLTSVSLNETQRQAVGELLNGLTSLQNGNPETIQQGLQLIKKLSHPAFVSTLIGKAKKSAPLKVAEERPQIVQRVMIILEINPLLTPNQVIEMLKVDYGFTGTVRMIAKIMKEIKQRKKDEIQQ